MLRYGDVGGGQWEVGGGGNDRKREIGVGRGGMEWYRVIRGDKRKVRVRRYILLDEWVAETGVEAQLLILNLILCACLIPHLEKEEYK